MGDKAQTNAADGDRADEQSIMKILLLGAGETGKSTILKQLQMLYQQELDGKFYRNWLVRNAIASTKGLVQIAKDQAEKGNGKPVDEEAAKIVDEVDEGQPPDQEAIDAISKLWESGVLEDAFKENTANPVTWLPDHALYYIGQIKTFCDPKFVPTHSQMLLTRSLTVGVNNVAFSDDVDGAYLMAHCPVAAQMLGSEEIGTACKLNWEVIDVGGQRGERRKWMNTLTDALGLIFTFGLSEYAQVLYEDPDTIRMQESLDLFDKWANHQDFARKPVVIAFTKKDIYFKNFDLIKFQKFFTDFVPTATGTQEIAQEGIDFIEKKVKGLLKDKRKKVESFRINTTDKDDFFDMLEGLKEIVAKHNNAKIMDAVQRSLDDKKSSGPGGQMLAQGNNSSDVPKSSGGCCVIA